METNPDESNNQLKKKKRTLHIFLLSSSDSVDFFDVHYEISTEGNSTYPIEKDEGDALFKV